MASKERHVVLHAAATGHETLLVLLLATSAHPPPHPHTHPPTSKAP